MKKYWKFTAILAVIVLSIGAFYVNSALSEEPFPEFVIQTQSGDSKEIESLVLEGSYSVTSSMSYVSTNLKITSEGSTYNSRSFLDQIIGHSPTVIKELQKEYRSFMRGKDAWVTSYFEDKQFLAYAGVEYDMRSFQSRDFKFDISVLNKEDGNIDSFTIEVPEALELEHVFVEDVQKLENEIYLITQNTMRNDNNYYNEKHIYTIDLANQNISSHEAIVQVSEGQHNTHTSIQLIGSDHTKATEQLIILKTEMKIIDDKESYREELTNQEIITYDLVAKEKESIDIPELKLDENYLSFFDGSTIYFTIYDEQGLLVTPYSLVDKQIGQVFSVPLSNQEGIAPSTIITVQDGKFYAVTSQMTPHLNLDADVVVADIKTGETLFKGQIALEDPAKEKGQFELYLHEIFVK
ncbi:hypothetical protein [Litchfieldia alkalitelluris]|uniref:hypothetical protein n=1 Tax=Litchfieldia alkalitelluris TaxID=304268 RepID=UPI0009975F4E|nr:hypothetical protein [Litchfieldia alkalitelluris]